MKIRFHLNQREIDCIESSQLIRKGPGVFFVESIVKHIPINSLLTLLGNR